MTHCLSLLLTLLSYWLISDVVSETIVCKQNTTCECSDSKQGESCLIKCTKGNSCNSGTLQCRSDDPCSIECIGTSSCTNIQINGNTATDVSVSCEGSNACETGIDLQCGTGDCSLECSSDTSCYDFGTVYISNSSSFSCVNCPNNITPLQFTTESTTHAPIDTTQFMTTTSSIILPDISAIFSDNYLKILISITFNVDNVLIITDDIYTCDDLLVESIPLLGHDALCLWNEYQIEIQLTSNSLILIHDIVLLSSDAFHYVYDDTMYALQNDTVLHVLPAANASKPLIIMDNVPSNIGICDDLILNAASTQCLGGRNAIFEWQFISSTPNHSNSYLMSMGSMYGDIVIIDAADVDIYSLLSVQLRVTTWYNITETSQPFNVYKSEHSTPQIDLFGPSTHSVTNTNYNQDYIHIYYIISSDANCINTSIYSLIWSMSSTTLQTDALQSIQTVINAANAIYADHIDIASTLIYPGNDYIFTVELNDTPSSSLSVYYEYSDIVCSVNSADTIYLDYITQEQFINDYVLFLDGYTMTYDPNAVSSSSKSHLNWEWQCILTAINASCDDLFDSSLSTPFSKYITFNNSIYTTYTFIMTVSDTTNIDRDDCISSVDLVLDFKPNDEGIAIKYLSVSTSVASLMINTDDRLRITVLMINDEIANYDEYYAYQWTERNSLLSNEDLTDMNINEASDSNGNLILESNVLQTGFVYEFQVNVTKWFINQDGTETMIGNGISPSIDIQVLNGPSIAELSIYPHCNGTYESLSELLSAQHYISVSADSDYLPLFYTFVYYFDDDPTQYEYVMHPSLLFKPYLFDVILPFGSFKLKTFVYDSNSQSSSNWKEIQCNIILTHYSAEEQCITLNDDISSTQALSDTLRSMEIYLNYMKQHYTNYMNYSTECLETSLLQFVDVLSNETHNFCTTDWSLLLAQIFTQYFDTLITLNASHVLFNNMDSLHSILSLILDPCDAISHTIMNVDLLFLSPQSIIDGNVIIYYGTQQSAIDITNEINMDILSDIDNSYVLYELSSSLLSVMDILNDDIVDLISKSLYIHALYSISSSIPGESVQSESDGFEIYSSRIAVGGDVNISIHDIQIAIDNDVFEEGRGSFCNLTQTNTNKCVYDSLDVIIIAQNNGNNNAVITEEDTCDHDMMSDYNGSVSNDSISIVIVGANLTQSISNTSIMFNYDDIALYDNFECVWFDDGTETWRNTGCSTVVNTQLKTVECVCNHLTTFTIAYNINFEDECNNFLSEIKKNRVVWNTLHIVFAILFTFVLLHSLHELLPFIVYNKFHPCEDQILFSMSSVSMISLINIILCISFTGTHYNVHYLTFLLLSPQWFYFIIFGIVLYSWILVSRSLDHGNEVDGVFDTKFLSKALQITTICLITLGILQFVIVLLIPDHGSRMISVYSISQILWLSLLLFASIIFTYFGYKTQHIVRITALMISTVGLNRSNTQNKESNALVEHNVQLSYKFLFSTIIIICFFLIQCILIIYFLFIDNYKHMLYFRIIDLLSHYICLLLICWLYKQTFDRLRNEYEIESLCNRPCVKRLVKKIKGKCKTTSTTNPIRANSVSVTEVTARKVSHSSAQLSDTGTTRPPSVQLSDKIVDVISLETIHEGLDDHSKESDDAESSLSSSSSIHHKQPKQRKQEPQPRQSVFARKELLMLTKPKLAKLCREQTLSSKGTKADMVKRLLDASKPKLAVLAPIGSNSVGQ